jgi:hypothetical protein
MKKSKFNNNVSLIKNAINNDKLVVFAGAGVSKDSGIPLRSELIEEISNGSSKLTDILIKTKVLAFKLKNEEVFPLFLVGGTFVLGNFSFFTIRSTIILFA